MGKDTGVERKLIINADDFGLCRGVNEAVKQAHQTGLLKSATIMANMPGTDQAIEIAAQTPSLGVGVHLNLTEGSPVSRDSRVSLLADSHGKFNLTPAALALKSLISAKTRHAIELELTAQIACIIARGLNPTHLDSHKHIHSFPAIFSIVCKLARRFSIDAVRYTFEPKEICRPPWPECTAKGKKRARTVRLMARANRASNPALLKTNCLLGVAHTGCINTDYYKALANCPHLGPTIELMTHPGYPEGLDHNTTRLINQRQIELDALCSQQAKNSLAQAGLKLVHYGLI